ncbi:Uncharacterised protein [uncultured archaeon]|nr:Uncharacterised protein [uncultured archaeon]
MTCMMNDMWVEFKKGIMYLFKGSLIFPPDRKPAFIYKVAKRFLYQTLLPDHIKLPILRKVGWV